ncbi:MAG: PadR family transcriptional regulator [Candidatus Melainabacteria bacterium]|nr:MAG: PadR family transcriptional regulator [Candidatus Melainabacteria bacterium]
MKKTGYSIKKEITKKFGSFIQPSSGALHPLFTETCSKKMLDEKKVLTDGGKKLSYFYLNKDGLKHFSKLFNKPLSSNPSVCVNEIYAKLACFKMANKEMQENFLENATENLKMFIIDAKNTLDDEYLKFDFLSKNFNKISNWSF